MTETPTVKILIVEDDKMCCVGLKLSLERFPNFAVIGEAANGQDAIDQAIDRKPDVILLDIGLPIINGIEVCRRVKASHPGIHVLMLTSHTDERIIRDSMAAGADGYFNKDVDMDVLGESIQKAADGKSSAKLH
ncbi:MAG: response regulator transcription factor [Cyanobacteria bacterium REEB67]|nr:response regulator transcription factor [Cyanobacteria bacterium REEB67]